MFDLNELKQDSTVLKELKVTCVEAKEGEEPVVIVEISDKIRKEEAKIAKRFNHLIFRQGDLSGTEFLSDKIGYLQAMTDLCVKDSQGLFSAGGRPAEHDNTAFKTLLLRYPAFSTWFGNALTEAFADSAKFKGEETADAEKNS